MQSTGKVAEETLKGFEPCSAACEEARAQAAEAGDAKAMLWHSFPAAVPASCFHTLFKPSARSRLHSKQGRHG